MGQYVHHLYPLNQLADILTKGLTGATFQSIEWMISTYQLEEECHNPLIYVAVNISLYNFNYIMRRFNYISELGGLIGYQYILYLFYKNTDPEL